MGSTETPRVAIVGGGFAGSLTAAHLLCNATKPLDVCLIERRPPFGAGRAFQTSLPCHLLNVPVIHMSAYSDDPEHLLRWLAGRFKGTKSRLASPGAYLPRQLYGEYVEQTLRACAEASSARFTRIVGEAVAIELDADRQILRLRMRDGSLIGSNRAVLAIGNPPPSDPLGNGDFRSSSRYAADPWDPGALDPLAADDPVVTIGSNLTMVDVALALEYRNHRGPIVAVSRHGLLPLPHRTELLPAWSSGIDGSTTGPRELLRAMRRDVRAAAVEGTEWRPVVDSIRKRTVPIWTSWPEGERRRFLRHAQPYWEIHRHRMAPDNADTIASLLETGRLRVVAGRIAGVREKADALEIEIRRRGTARTEVLRASRVVNCTGPGMDFRSSSETLVRDLLARGLARPGPLGLGFDADGNQALIGSDGRPSPVLFTLGPPLKGCCWETTAVPEIREQAKTLGERLAGS